MLDPNVILPGQPARSLGRRRYLSAGGCAIALIVCLRFLGLLQPLEWRLFDRLLRWRPEEPLEKRITLITIDEADIEQVGSYPIPDLQLAQMLEQLKSYKPRAIGLDIVRDLPVETGYAQLQQVFATTPELIVINSILPPVVAAPANIPAAQVGFVDVPMDLDGFLRRDLLGAYDLAQQYQFSLTIRLVEAYLKMEGIPLENGIRDREAMRFGSLELPRFRPHSGAYVRGETEGYGILLSPRNRAQPFRQVSMATVLAGEANPDWLRDRILLIGVTAPSVKDIVNARAIRGQNPGLVTGVEYRAHGVSQILAAVLDGRPLLQSWREPWDYLWILAWGGLGLGLASLTRSPGSQMLGAGLGAGSLTLISALALWGGWWLPLGPALLGFGFNSTVLYAFQLYEQGLKARLRERQTVIEQSFDAIHTGPLQSLAQIQRQSYGQRYGRGAEVERLQDDLQRLDQELRQVYEFMRHEAVTPGQTLYLDGGKTLDLAIPLHELLFQVYAETLKRGFPGFQTLKVRIVEFEAMVDGELDDSLRQDLGRFLQEALCNAGKYGEGMTRLRVTCKAVGDRNIIEVIDNGAGLSATEDSATAGHQGQGTQQAQRLARALNGQFERSPHPPRGICCRLSWPGQRGRRWNAWWSD